MCAQVYVCACVYVFVCMCVHVYLVCCSREGEDNHRLLDCENVPVVLSPRLLL